MILAASLLLPARSFPAPGQKSPATADEAVSRGDDAFRHNRWTEAEGLYLDAAGRVPRSPRYAEAMRKAGHCRVKLKDYRKARKHFEAAAGDARSRKDSPDEAARAFSALHALLLEHGDAAARERVLADFRRALPDSPLAGEAKAALAKAKRAGKEMAKAEADAAARKDAAAKEPFGASLRKAEVLEVGTGPIFRVPISGDYTELVLECYDE